MPQPTVHGQPSSLIPVRHVTTSMQSTPSLYRTAAAIDDDPSYSPSQPFYSSTTTCSTATTAAIPASSFTAACNQHLLRR